MMPRDHTQFAMSGDPSGRSPAAGDEFDRMVISEGWTRVSPSGCKPPALAVGVRILSPRTISRRLGAFNSQTINASVSPSATNGDKGNG